MSVQAETSVLRLTLPAKPEYLMFTRLLLTGLSRSVEIDPEALADLKLAVSEACSYSIREQGGEDGLLEISYEVADAELAVSVAVKGPGTERAPRPNGESDDDLGLVIIEALVHELEITRSEQQLERIFFRKRLEPPA